MTLYANAYSKHVLLKGTKYKLFVINHEKQRTVYEIIACCYDVELLEKIKPPTCDYKYVYLEQSLSKLKVIENMYYQAYFVTSILCFFDRYGSKKQSVKSKTKIANAVSGLQGYVKIEKYRAPLIALWEIIETSFGGSALFSARDSNAPCISERGFDFIGIVPYLS